MSIVIYLRLSLSNLIIILRFILSYCSLLLVGVGSWSFHMTLRYEMQLLDEIPMIFASCTLVYCIMQVMKISFV